MRFAGTQLSNFMDPTNFDAISFASMGGETKKQNAVNTAYGARDIGGIQGDMYRDLGQYEAMGVQAQGEAQSAANWAQGISGLASGISGGLMAKAGGTPATPKPKPGTTGLGVGFNIGPGQAGLDPIDLDGYLLNSPFSAIPS